MKDLIAGSLGRLDDAGGSSMFAVPRTIYVPPEYEIETDVPSVAKFVTCSLDGRLWVWQRSRRYYVAAFRWNEETQRLEFVSTTVLNGETVIRRGVDWILTDKSFFLTSNDEPYFTRTEYASDDTSYSVKLKYHYSFYPELYQWKFINWGAYNNYYGRIRLQESSGKISNIRYSDISIYELLFYNDFWYGNGQLGVLNKTNKHTNFRLYCFNGQLYAKGEIYMGRAYLYRGISILILPDYCRNYNVIRDTSYNGFVDIETDDTDGWDSLFFIPLCNSHVGIFTPTQNNFSLCKKSENARVFDVNEGDWIDYSEDNGSLLFDIQTNHSLVISDKGVAIPSNNVEYEGRIRQWVTPSMDIASISPNFITSQTDKVSLTCFLQEGFYRALLNCERTQFVSEKESVLASKNVSSNKNVSIYKLTSFMTNMDFDLFSQSMFHDFCQVEGVNLVDSDYYDSWHFPVYYTHTEIVHHTATGLLSENPIHSYDTYHSINSLPSSSDFFPGYASHHISCSIDIFWVLPENGNLVNRTLSASCSSDVLMWIDEAAEDPYRWKIQAESVGIQYSSSERIIYKRINYYTPKSECPYFYGPFNGGYHYFVDYTTSTTLLSFDNVLSSLGRWKNAQYEDDDNVIYLSLNGISNNQATFTVVRFGIRIVVDISDVLSSYNLTKTFESNNVDNYYSSTGGFTNSKGEYIPTEFRHVVKFYHGIMTLKSEYTPEIISLLQKLDNNQSS